MSASLSSGIAAYTSAKYEEAVSIFLVTLEDNRLDWWAWFYLGMSYAKVGRVENAYRIMQVICALCSDATVKSEARSKIAELEDELFGVTRKEFATDLKRTA
jgi:tetratricopeptide (TPR) repeat protein